MTKILLTGKSLDYEGITGDVEVEASEALRALEDQAPEVLRGYCAERLSVICGLTVGETMEQLLLHEEVGDE